MFELYKFYNKDMEHFGASLYQLSTNKGQTINTKIRALSIYAYLPVSQEKYTLRQS